MIRPDYVVVESWGYYARNNRVVRVTLCKQERVLGLGVEGKGVVGELVGWGG